jgi:hypothetical protein
MASSQNTQRLGFPFLNVGINHDKIAIITYIVDLRLIALSHSGKDKL